VAGSAGHCGAIGGFGGDSRAGVQGRGEEVGRGGAGGRFEVSLVILIMIYIQSSFPAQEDRGGKKRNWAVMAPLEGSI
jgi:hypothetical protein